MLYYEMKERKKLHAIVGLISWNDYEKWLYYHIRNHLKNSRKIVRDKDGTHYAVCRRMARFGRLNEQPYRTFDHNTKKNRSVPYNDYMTQRVYSN